MLPRLPEQLRYLLAGLVLVSFSIFALTPVYPLAVTSDPPGLADPLGPVAPARACNPGIGMRPWSDPCLAPPPGGVDNTLQLGVRG